MVRIEAAQAVVAHLEGDAGPTLRRDIEASKIIERAVDQTRLRQEMTKRLLSQRAGLFKLCNTESTSDDFDQPTARVRLYFDRLLDLSANLAAVSGSGWPAVWGWFRDRLPLPADRIGAKALEAAFDVKLKRATALIAGRPILRLWDLHTAPSATELAETFGTTMAALRNAKATKNMLTGIDALPKGERNRVAMESARRAKGAKAQADRVVRERDRELANLAGVSDRWIRKHRLAGSLGTFLAGKGVDVPETGSSQIRVSPKDIMRTRKWELVSCSPKKPSRMGTLTTLSRPVPRMAPRTSTGGRGPLSWSMAA